MAGINPGTSGFMKLAPTARSVYPRYSLYRQKTEIPKPGKFKGSPTNVLKGVPSVSTNLGKAPKL